MKLLNVYIRSLVIIYWTSLNWHYKLPINLIDMKQKYFIYRIQPLALWIPKLVLIFFKKKTNCVHSSIHMHEDATELPSAEWVPGSVCFWASFNVIFCCLLGNRSRPLALLNTAVDQLSLSNFVLLQKKRSSPFYCRGRIKIKYLFWWLLQKKPYRYRNVIWITRA